MFRAFGDACYFRFHALVFTLIVVLIKGATGQTGLQIFVAFLFTIFRDL